MMPDHMKRDEHDPLCSEGIQAGDQRMPCDCDGSMSREDLITRYSTLRAANAARQQEWDAENQITLSYRGNELAGETGEACNVIKKLERERLGIRGSRGTVAQLAEELADVVICADLIAMAEGIDLDAAVAAKFNQTSEKVGLKARLAAALSPAAEGEPIMQLVDETDSSAVRIGLDVDRGTKAVASISLSVDGLGYAFLLGDVSNSGSVRFSEPLPSILVDWLVEQAKKAPEEQEKL